MSQLSAIQDTQQKLEESFSKRMSELEAQLNVSGSSKDTVAKVADEFRAFRELMFGMLRLLRQQISECSNMLDAMETRHRRKALVFFGVREEGNEDCCTVVQNTLTKMSLKDITSSVRVCHRIGSPNKDQHRPLLVWFTSAESRSAVWRAKSRLKGSSISVKEFLTKPRQLVFAKARHHFGMRECWTQDGVIIIKTPNGTRRRISKIDELISLTMSFPKSSDDPSSLSSSGSGNISKQRKT